MSLTFGNATDCIKIRNTFFYTKVHFSYLELLLDVRFLTENEEDVKVENKYVLIVSK